LKSQSQSIEQMFLGPISLKYELNSLALSNEYRQIFHCYSQAFMGIVFLYI